MNKKASIVKISDAKTELEKLEKDKREVEKRFGDGQPYEYERMIAKASGFVAQATVAFIEIGRCLIRIKTNEPSQNYFNALNRLEISKNTAYLYIRAAANFGQTTNLKALPLRKLDVLGQLSEGEIKELDQKGSLGSIKVDELDTMPAEELRKLIRKERKRDTKRLKRAEQQYYQVKNERDHLKENTGTSPEFDRYTSAATRSIAHILNMNLSKIEIKALDEFIKMTSLQVERMSRRAHPEKFPHDPDVEQGKVEARMRKRKH